MENSLKIKKGIEFASYWFDSFDDDKWLKRAETGLFNKAYIILDLKQTNWEILCI